MTTIIIVSIAALLVIMGATQRKKLVTLIRAEAHSALKEAANSVKVLDLRITDLRVAINKMIDNAASIYAKELEYTDKIRVLKERVVRLLEDAKTAKESGKEAFAKSKVGLKLACDSELKILEENLKTLVGAKEKIELNISKANANIARYELKLEGLKTRQSANDVLKAASSNVAGLGEVSMDESFEMLDTKVTHEENKLTYKSGVEDNDSSFSADIEAEFEKLG